MSNNPKQLNATVAACPVQLDVVILDATIADAPNWAVLVGTLYRLCDEHPGHADQAGSNAKLWLIGRGLATGVERQIESTGGQGSSMNALCKYVHENHTQTDEIIAPLLEIEEPLTPDKLCRVVEAHGRFCRLIQPVLRDGRSARSFAAKYLHCHAPSVPIFDSVARDNLSYICPWQDSFQVFEMPEGADDAYYWFALRFWQMYRAATAIRPNVTVRLLDLYLLSPQPDRGDDEEGSQGKKELTLKVLRRHGILPEGTKIEVMPDAISKEIPKGDRKLFRAEIGDIDSRKSVIWVSDGNAYSLTELSCLLEEHGLRWVRPKTFQLWSIAGEDESMWDRADRLR